MFRLKSTRIYISNRKFLTISNHQVILKSVGLSEGKITRVKGNMMSRSIINVPKGPKTTSSAITINAIGQVACEGCCES